MIEAFAQVVCTVIQVEAGAHGPSTVFEVRLPSGEATSVNALDVRLNAIGYSARQDLVYGLDDDGRLVALDRRGRVVGQPTRPSHLLRQATAGAVVGERLVVRAGPRLESIDIDPASPTFGQVVQETWLSPLEGMTVDDFDLNPADGLLYGVATHQHNGIVVSIDPRTGRTRAVPGVGQLPGGTSYGAVTVARDGSLYATNNRQRDGRSSLWRVALDGSGVVTEISSGPPRHTIDATGCLPAPPPTTTPTTTTTTTTTTTPTTTTTTTTTTTPTTTPPTTTTTPPTTTTTAPPQPTTTTTVPRTTTTTTPPPVVTTIGPAPAVPPRPNPPPPPPVEPPPPPFEPPPFEPPPQPEPQPEPEPDNPPQESPLPPPALPPPPRADLKIPDREVQTLAPTNNAIRDQRRWGLVALLLIVGAGALARQAASRRR
ncbi:hypothetical protein ACIGNX_26675 [Actinosynnema sp. NPDC053489]|uniref:hypothetical protein n=1 Tax=Actinosynnema sp. NPDC053489 TaxID=3363916 RepID=UPI0037CB743B